MPKSILPVYSICSLSDQPVSSHSIIADHFANYLNKRKDLHLAHKHSFYHFVYFAKAEGAHSIDFIQFPAEPGQIYFMTPGQVHSWNFDTTPDGYIVNFSLEYLQSFISDPRYLDQFSFFSGIAKEQVIKIPATARDHFTSLLELIVREQQADHDCKEDLTRALLIQVFILANRYAHKENYTSTGKFNSLLLRNFKKLIDLHYKEKKLTSDYASMLYVTPNHLNALTKDSTDHTAGELIRDRIILEAKRLLVNANQTIAEIADELDFADNSYFSKFFKKNVGVTPETFRKQIKELK